MDPKLKVEQLLTAVVFTVSGTDGKFWTIQVDESNIKSGYGDTTFNTDLFPVGSHTAVLWIAGFMVATTPFVVKEVYYPPPITPPTPPPPTPPPGTGSGEEKLDAIGTSCHLIHLYGGTFERYLYESDVNGSRSKQYDNPHDAIYAGINDVRCQQTVAPPEPEAPVIQPVMDELGGLEITVFVPTLNGVTYIQQVSDLIKTTTANIKTRTDLLWMEVSSLPEILAGMQKMLAWDWDKLIVQPINTLLQPARDVLAWTQKFTWPDWKSVIVTPVSDYIDLKISNMFGIPVELPFWEGLTWKFDVWISGLFGVDPKLDFFNALWAKTENKIDVWFSKLLEIDPQKPFWDELRAKYVPMLIESLNEILAETLPEVPKPGKDYWRQK